MHSPPGEARVGFLIRLTPASLWVLVALAMSCCQCHAGPMLFGRQLLVEFALPHVPPDAKLTIALDGKEVRTFPASEGKAIIEMPEGLAGAHTLSLTVADPHFRGRVLYFRSTTLRMSDADTVPPGGERTRVLFGLDGIAWGLCDSDPAPNEAIWDPSAVPDEFLGRAWPQGELRLQVDIASRSAETKRPPAEVRPGEKNLRVTVRMTNDSEVPQRVLATGLRLTTGEADATSRFFVLPLSGLPGVIPARDEAEQTFRLDSFDDTPPGEYEVQPVVVHAAADADVLTEGTFDEQKTLDKATDDTASEWGMPEHAPEGLRVSALPAGASLADLSIRVADWDDYAKLSFVNSRHIATQGTGLLEAAFADAPRTPSVVAEQAVAEVTEGQPYLLCMDSWSGSNFAFEFRDRDDLPLAGHERNFSGFGWRETVANWRARTVLLGAPQRAHSAKLRLLAQEKTTWWDNGFLGPQSALRRSVGSPITLKASDPAEDPAHPAPYVVYLGEDWDTKGNWVGNYGSYCWILCAMSSPRDMVGGQAKPIKCHHDDMTRKYANETIWLRGEDEFRYCSWTGDPKDVLTRHWIGAMRTEEVRALENPQWGYRTYASWDEHGELHPSDAWGPDLYVKLKTPPGLWRVSLYFIDWDWHAAPFPRAHRLAFLDTQGNELCTARVTDFGDGVYKIFGVHGGRDVVFRIRKEFSATVVLSGVFLDRIEPFTFADAGSGRQGPSTTRLARRLEEMAALYESDPTDFLRHLSAYGDIAALGLGDGRGGPAQAIFGRRVQYQLLGRVAGRLPDEARAFRAYARALQEASGAGPVAWDVLVRIGDKAFENNDLRHAELAYDEALALQTRRLEGAELADNYKQRALQFRIVHPLYALDKCRGCLKAAESMKREQQIAYVREAAQELFDTAARDWKNGRGIVRVQYALPTEVYRRLVHLVGYDGLSPAHRENLVSCLTRQTWYTLGWRELAAEQERLLASLQPEQVTGRLLQGLLRTYGVLAQKDHTYIAKAEEVAERMKGQLPDGDYVFAATFKLMQIYYHERRWDKARKLCEDIIAKWPDEPEAKQARRLLGIMKP